MVAITTRITFTALLACQIVSRIPSLLQAVIQATLCPCAERWYTLHVTLLRMGRRSPESCPSTPPVALPPRPCELHAPVAEVMSALCCAEAQALTAWRSEERASSPPLVAALHAGCAQLYEQAAKGLRTASGGSGLDTCQQLRSTDVSWQCVDDPRMCLMMGSTR